jgi:hypothetical protein
MVNLAGIIYYKSGTVARSTFALSDFFLLPTSSMSDPEILFDAGSGRWLASIIDIPNGRVQFAVSTSNDPTGTWNLYFVSTPRSTTLPDQPFIGASDDKFVISANDFAGGTTFVGVQYWILNKAELVTGAATIHLATNAPDPSFASVHPAHHMGSSSGLFYMVSVFPVGTASSATLFTVGGSPGVSTVTVTTNNFAINPISVPPDAVQPGTSTLLATNDNRILSAAWESNILWFAATDACIPSGDTSARSCVRLIQLTTSGTAPPSKGLDFDFAQSGQYLFYPAVSLFQGQLVVVYGVSSSTVYPSLLVTGRAPGDPANSLQTPATIRTGTAPDTSTRYGDYFGAATDPTPSSTSTFWVAGEYRISSGFQSWNTAIAQVGSFGAPPAPYSAMFFESGIPTGTSWGVIVGGTRYTSTTTSVTVSGLTGTVTYTYDATVSGSAIGTQYACNTGCSGSVSPSATTATSTYKTQYLLTMQVSPSGSGTTSPAIGTHWYDSELLVTISATANAGYAFSSWSGAGTGSYSGVANPASVTMNSPITETANFVTAPFDFSVSVDPASGSVVQGGTQTATVTVTLLSGSTQPVTLSTALPVPPPTGISVVLSTVTGNPTFTSTLTMSTTTSIPTGTYTITVTGTGGGLTRSGTYKLTVTSAPPPDFGISASPASVTIDPGTTGTSTITVNSLNGFSGTVGLTSSSLPSGVTAGFSPNPVTIVSGGSAMSTLALTVAPNTTPGTYVITVTGTANGSSVPPRSVSITITITNNVQESNHAT